MFNPASNTKVATALVILRKFGPNYRFRTEIRSNGKVNSRSELEGDLFISGQDPIFGERRTKELEDLLWQKNIKSINGDLCVSDGFSMNMQTSGLQAGKSLAAHLKLIKVHGHIKVASPPADSKMLAYHDSVPLQGMLKTMLCFSDNAMAEQFGVIIGGPLELTNYVVKNLGISKDEVNFITTSGVTTNQMTPRAMMKVLSALKSDLLKLKMELPDLFPVAGVDNGTMNTRLRSEGEIGSVAAKTGSLGTAASALAGEMNTSQEGKFLFVIFNNGVDIDILRKRQDQIVLQFQKDHSGAKAYKYSPIPLIYLNPGQWSK
jgi:D-alanyl-D-alanine carboxypeptidase/D-alanyl-D-alanine-endopeptidase (penicillin-binding protein 4)